MMAARARRSRQAAGWLDRRRFLGLSAASLALLRAGAAAADAPGPAGSAAAVFVPGYAGRKALIDGRPAAEDPHLARWIPQGYRGPATLLTRLGLDGGVTRALLPVNGHGIEIAAGGRAGYFGAMEGRFHLGFDAVTLDVFAVGQPEAEGWRGGGHAQILPAGDAVAFAERSPRTTFTGDPAAHFGRVTLRDPATLAVLGSVSSHGIDPHDIRLLPDGHHLAIGNYGSVPRPGETALGVPRHVVEAAITVVDLRDGRLADKIVTGREMELRHLATGGRDRLFAIQALLSPEAAAADPTAAEGVEYLPAPTLRADLDAGRAEAIDPPHLREMMRHGLSIRFDPVADEAIATFPTSHAILVYDGATGAVKRATDARAFGMDWPAGLVLLPDGAHYAVTGHGRGLLVFARGSHELRSELSLPGVEFHGHSHIAAG